ncbi:MAG TPA: endonuclease/exonuclease/phosphatase family protein [Chloroflexota bacterium]|nr:endonuclease/exonuclease/phosphatase family protein [Chloroflexota bacterium]
MERRAGRVDHQPDSHASVPHQTHLQHTGGAGSPDRTVQVRRLVELIGSLRPAVLTGDLNALPQWPELDPLEALLEDAWTEAGRGPGYTYPAHPTREPDRRIDYVFVSKDVAVRQATVTITPVTRLAADHYPVVADVTLPAPPLP